MSVQLSWEAVTIQSDCIVTGCSLGWRSVSLYNLLYRDKLRVGLLGCMSRYNHCIVTRSGGLVEGVTIQSFVS